MSFKHVFREHIILPISDLVNQQQVCRYLRLLREAELWDEKRMRSFQEQRFRELVRYASREVPFYREWFSNNGLDPESVSLDQLPIVNKSLIRSEGIEWFSSKATCGYENQWLHR